MCTALNPVVAEKTQSCILFFTKEYKNKYIKYIK